MRYDTSLVKIIHRELYGVHEVIACITRFGSLVVYVERTDTFVFVYEGTNILDAREHAMMAEATS